MSMELLCLKTSFSANNNERVRACGPRVLEYSVFITGIVGIVTYHNV